ncbi:MAG: hypothetical protein LBR10_15220 [Prevotellaceae bacterium]|jgi:hypothetical protein|nr:hypothetical protein [Prevotellaceae bacterium]
MELFFVTAILIALCFAGTGIRIWIKGEFADTEIGRNKNMRKLGITCTKEDEMKLYGNNHSDNKDCGTCFFATKCLRTDDGKQDAEHK